MPSAIIESAGAPATFQGSDEGVEYRFIPGFPGYAVGDDGTVWTCRAAGSRTKRREWRRKRLSRWAERLPVRSYYFTSLAVGGVAHQIYVHRLVLSVFRGPPIDDQECRHINGDHLDNRLANLTWGTREENVADKLLHGTEVRGERNGRAMITDDDVRAIRARRAAGESLGSIARDYTLSKVAIGHVCRRYTWKHVE